MGTTSFLMRRVTNASQISGRSSVLRVVRSSAGWGLLRVEILVMAIFAIL